MSPWVKTTILAERYDLALFYMRDEHLPPDIPRPLPTKHWPAGNVEMLERYRDWLLGGGVSEMVTNIYHVMMAGHVLGLTLKPYTQIDPDADLECALDYVKAKGLSVSWTKNCKNSLLQFRRFLRLERGLGDESKVKPFDVAAHTQGLPLWVVNELERYQHLCQRNWRTARLDASIRSFWSKYSHIWRFLCQERGVKQLADLKRQFILDYVDKRLAEGRVAKSVNGELRYLHTFLLFLQEEGYTVPQSLLRIPSLKEPDSLPKYLTDEQVKKLREEIECNVREARLASHKRLALLIRAEFYLLWQGGLRLGEVEELRLEDIDIPQRRLTVRNGKGLQDRTIYLTETAILALQDYLAVRGDGSTDHVFLYRNSPFKKDLLRAQLKSAGKHVGVKVYPHRLRHTCATQLLNAGCRITSIQAFLGHKKLNTTMIYARAHDQTVAEDYFAAMQRVEQRLDIVPAPKEAPKPDNKVVNLPETQVLFWIERLAQPELCQQERLEIAANLKQAFCMNFSSQLSPPMMAIAG